MTMMKLEAAEAEADVVSKRCEFFFKFLQFSTEFKVLNPDSAA